MISQKPQLEVRPSSIGLIILASCLWGTFVLGPKPLDIFDTSWLWHDLAQVYLAWAQYTSDPNAHWLMSSRQSYPLELNFALFDPMPIFLLTFGKLSPFLPDRTQYFGIYFLLCLILQGVLGYLILKKTITFSDNTSQQNETYCVLGAMFFVLAPYTFYRFQQHIALASHWIILFSIWISLSTRLSKLPRWILFNCSAVILATGLNPYLTLMVLVSQSCIVIFDFYKSSYLQLSLRIIALMIAAGLGFKVFGFLSASGVRDYGYGIFSMNMLGPFSSNGWGYLLPVNIPDPTNWQSWEGFNYQGLGVFILLSLSIIFAIRHKPSYSHSFPYRSAFVIIFISYALALSTTITFSSIIIKPYVPSILIHFLSAFRASGRLFWVGGYWLILIGLVTLALYSNKRRATYILALLFVIQFIDVSGIAMEIRNKISTIKRASINIEKIDLPKKKYDALVVLPPWQCNTEKAAGGGNNYEHLGFFAADNKINTNNFYAARILPEQTQHHCSPQQKNPELSENTLYAISPEFFNTLSVAHKERIRCTLINEYNFYLCTYTDRN